MVEAIRRAKGTPGQNMWHVLHMGVVLLALILLFLPALERLAEHILMPDTPISAELELVWDEGEVKVRYRPVVLWDVEADWIGQLRDAQGGPLYTKRAPETLNYGPGVSKSTSPWPWTGWWEDYRLATDAANPPVPDVAFQICVRYVGTGAKGGKTFNTAYQCSDVFSDHLQEAG